MPTWSTRKADASDRAPLQSLLIDSCAASVIPSSDRLDTAVARGLVRVAETDGVLTGCLVAEAPSEGHVRLSVLAVHPARRRRGVAAQLLADAVRDFSDQQSEPPLISVLADPRDTALSRLFLSCGFLGTRLMRTGGSEEDVRIHYQHKPRIAYVDPDARHLVPVEDREQLAESLAPSDHAVTALLPLGGGSAFEVARFEQDDPATLQSGEAAAGIAFAGSILAAITFLLGFAFSSTRFPDDVRLLLIGATFSTVLSLIVYASASGELARIRSNSFGKVMKWGNVLSEYGGVLPFLISLPVTYAQASGNLWTTMVLAVALSAAIAWYERSEFSIAHRFRRSLAERALTVLTAASPAVGAGLVAADATSWPWTIALLLTLAARTWLYLFRRGSEADIAERRQWRIGQSRG
ncbi:GNAT family N-acetyltransferase [Streptomyces sp. NPDC059402]|uniref:GNAT family N-acetyltransferase n=1 Tax=Streptomyces sp. NPDC059402 TaxID=3346822 RepID=UPI0036A4A162